MNLQQERLEALCAQLKLDRIASHYAAIAQQAARDELSFSDFLEQVFTLEVNWRSERSREVLLRMASFPAVKTLQSYDFGFASGVPKAHIQELAGLAFIERAENIVLLGPSAMKKAR